MTTNEDFFVPENKQGEDKEHLSPSGKYKLTVSCYGTSPGCWSYTRGILTSVETSEVIADVKRNFSSFPFFFLENHPSGHTYLVTGSDYQGQTIIEVDTGKIAEHLPEAAKKGVGFCWVESRFEPTLNLLIVCGCVWACPYEFRFYEFSDPMNKGWTEIPVEKDSIDEDRRWPSINEDGTLRCYYSEYNDDDEVVETPIRATKTLRREGDKFVVVEEWVSEEEKKHRAEQDEACRKYHAKMKVFYETDPLYLTYLELVKDPELSPEDHSGIGVTYKNWCSTWEGHEQRYCRRIVSKADTQPFVIDLEWAMETGPVKLEIFKGGSLLDTKFWFEHSVESIKEAFAYAKEVLGGKT